MGVAPALGTGHLPGDRDGPRLGWDMGHEWAWLSGVRDQAGRVCGKLEPSPAATSLRQGLMSSVG